MDTSIVNAMMLAEEKTTLDKHVINLFTHKSILALLMKYCVQEFSSFTPKQIMEECIVGEPAARKIAVHRDELDALGAPIFPVADLAEDMLDGNERIQGINTVDKTQREGTTIYDIIFQAKVPETGAMIGLIINVEIQNDEKLLYYVVTRGLYYCARMLSAQKNRIFMHSDYQKIQKVYSIWICPYAKNGKNTIASYDVNEHVHFGYVDVPKEAYDKLETVVITMNTDGIKSESELIRYLSLLLNREMPQEERVEALKNEYHIQVDDALREDVSKMCNYSDAILRMGENKGLEQGRIMEAVSIYRDEMEMDDNSIIKKIMKRFTLQEQDARKYVIPQSNAKN